MIFAPNQNLNSSLSSGESLNFTNIQVPEPIRGNEGSTWLSPEVNNELNRQNPDTLAPPKTDHGDVCEFIDRQSSGMSTFRFLFEFNSHLSSAQADFTSSRLAPSLSRSSQMAILIISQSARRRRFRKATEPRRLASRDGNGRSEYEIGALGISRITRESIEMRMIFGLFCVMPHRVGILIPGLLFRLSCVQWHLAGEWSYIINGSARISAINEEGQNFIDDVYAGDLWYFPTGRPHSIQALGDGVEFLLVVSYFIMSQILRNRKLKSHMHTAMIQFDTGNFSEDDTFLITDWLAHTPKEVISKNFQLPESSFSTLPTSELYIFPGTPSTSPLSSSSQNISAPNGTINPGYSYHFSKQQPMEIGGKGGTVKIADTRNFPASTTIAAALVTIEPGAMREMHWHPSSDEWNYFVSDEME